MVIVPGMATIGNNKLFRVQIVHGHAYELLSKNCARLSNIILKTVVYTDLFQLAGYPLRGTISVYDLY